MWKWEGPAHSGGNGNRNHVYDSGASRPSNYSHHQDMHFMSERPSSLGLSLKKTASLVNLIERELYHTNKNENSTSPMPMSEKLKASNFRANFLKIGDWEVISRHDGNIVAKCYYAKRKLVWEILDGPLKSKIELQWSNIVGIRATMVDNQESILEIELNEPPLFYRETAPQPKKHTLWQQSHDFTGGHANKYRRHYVRFPANALEKTYENILLCDQRLNDLSRSPFPSHQSPYFDSNGVYGSSQFYGQDFGATHQCQYQNYPPTFVTPHLQNLEIHNQLCGTLDLDSPMSVMNFNSINDQENNYSALTQPGDDVRNPKYVEKNTDQLQVLPHDQQFNVLNYDEETNENIILTGFFDEDNFLGYPYNQRSISLPRSPLCDPFEGVNIMNSNARDVMLAEPSSEQPQSPLLWWLPDESPIGSSSMMELPQQNQSLKPALHNLPSQDFPGIEGSHRGVQRLNMRMPVEDWSNATTNY